ncbi:MAG: DNA mismatch repair protein MutT, partial [Pseudomonadota bacterium]
LGGRDHVALFVVRDVPAIDPGALIPQATEIAEAGVFPLDGLPQGTTGAVRRRLGEVFAGKPIDETW